MAQYSGGVADIVGPLGSQWSANYSLNSGTGFYGGTWISADEWNPTFAGRPGSVTCHGQITVTFTWIGEKGEETPDYVVLEKISHASWHGDSGSAANWLGDPEVYPDPFSGVSSNTSPQDPEYVVIAEPDETFTVNEYIDTNESHLEVYFRKHDNFTISCQLTVPYVGSFSFSKGGLANKPSAVTAVEIGTLPLFDPNNLLPVSVRHGYIIPNSNPPEGTPGISWAGTIDTPAPFDEAGTGEWALVQIIRPYRRWDGYYQGTYQPLMWYDLYTGEPINGLEGLDSYYPYENIPWWPANGIEAGSDDSPAQGVGDTWVEVVDSFNTYYMYRPPSAPYGSGRTQVVSLEKLEWYWEAYANNDPSFGHWVWTARSAAWQYLEDFPKQPAWIYRHHVDKWQEGPG